MVGEKRMNARRSFSRFTGGDEVVVVVEFRG